MIKSYTHIVRPQDERPGRRDGTCFYCKAPIGSPHKDGCVIRTKTCVVDFTIRMVVPVPENWDEAQIDYHYNDGTWCADNLIEDVNDWETETGRCLCNITTAKFIREATAADEEHFGYDPAKEC